MRRAHTLMELLVVLTLLSLVASVALPRLIIAWGFVGGEAAVEQLRSDFALARARAVNTGLRHQLSLDPQSGEVVVDVRRVDLEISNSTTSTGKPILRDQIPEGVSVVEWTVLPLGMSQATSRTGGRQSPDVVVFYPEGRNDDASLILQDRQGRRYGLKLDGFSGELRDMTAEELQ